MVLLFSYHDTCSTVKLLHLYNLQETDPERATISSVKLAMKEVGMTEAMEAVFGIS